MTEPARPSADDPAQPAVSRETVHPAGPPVATPAPTSPPPGVGPAPSGPQAGGYAPVAGAQPGHGPVPPPPRDALRPPKRIDPVPGTPFGVVHLEVPPVTSGPAVGSLVAGVVSILVSLLVGCFGLVGAGAGWGAWAAGAFTLLGFLTGLGAIVAGLFGVRQVRRPAPPPAVRFTGRGLAVAGISCGAVGLTLCLVGLGLAVALQLA